ncbi:MAG: hypothetical protein KAJ78_07705, partial [Acidobacteria bacterium]|nr:hypothetical protein [Acidobacteriota bacterium]
DPDYDAGLVLSPACVLVAAAQKSTCTINFTGDLVVWDSLSVFVKTKGGNFEGASACILIDPDGVNP